MSRGPGRPRRADGLPRDAEEARSTVAIKVRLDRETADAFRSLAAQNGDTLSDALTRLVRDRIALRDRLAEARARLDKRERGKVRRGLAYMD